MGALRHRGAAGQGAVRGHLLLLGRSAPRRRSRSCAAWARRCSSTSRPTRCSTAGSSPTCSTSSGARAWAHRLLAARAGHAHRPLPRRHPRGLARGARAARCRSRCSARRTSTRVRALNEIAQRRGQTLAQMALAWTLRDPRVTSALIGASSVAQLEDNVGALDAPGLRRRRAGRDRPVRGRRRHQHLGAVELGLTVVCRAACAALRGANSIIEGRGSGRVGTARTAWVPGPVRRAVGDRRGALPTPSLGEP